MKVNVITISRQFGSGGRTVGRKLAEALGFKFYDSELVKKISDETGFNEKFIEDKGEHSTYTSKLASIFNGRQSYGAMNGQSTADYLWGIENKIIKDVAEEGGCVIVGRCSDYILRERTDVLDIYIHADDEFRANRIVRNYGEPSEGIEKAMKVKDKKRATYYSYYTERNFGDADNYHIALDTGVLGVDNAVKIVLNAIEAMEQE